MITRSETAVFLSGCPLFSGMSAETVRRICLDKGMYIRCFEKGDTIYRPNDFERAAGIIASGSVSVYKGKGKSRTLLNTIGKSGIFGVASLFGTVEEYVTEVVALEKTEVIFLSLDLSRRLVCGVPEFALNYVAFLSDRIRYLNKKIDGFTAPSARAKLAKYLSGCGGGSVNLTKLASELDIGRASLYRELDALVLSGIIEKDGRNITVKDKHSLAGLARGE